MSSPRSRVITGVRPEIQALRAFAVLVVVIYHIWPERLEGGFTGVDVFFVISGFLITAHLMREVVSTGRVSLAAFWARRARRLLPASITVILASAVGTLLFVPTTLWGQFFREFGAAGIYIENWALASDAVDYLASDNVASPVQHYWSLSVEEQFYIVWPLLIVLALLLARKKSTRRYVGIVLGVVVASSLVVSVIQTQTDPAIAYFSTATRAWEFGAGGLLALFAPAARAGLERIRTAVSLAGWVVLAVTAVVYTSATPFPGIAAALPVVGTLAVIWAGSEGLRVTPTFIGRIRPVQFVGDISYSVYLWHWPIIILFPFVFDRQLAGLASIAVLLASLVLGWLSKILIEDPVRTSGLARLRPRFSLLATAAAMLLVVAISVTGTSVLRNLANADEARVNDLLAAETACFGAAASDPDNQPCVNPELEGVVLPGLTSSKLDFDNDQWSGCVATGAVAEQCTLGVKGGTRVALVGDSHAFQWAPAIEDLADQEGWELHLVVKGACSWSHAQRDRRNVQTIEDCESWNSDVDAYFARNKPFTYVFTAQRAELNKRMILDGNLDSRETAIRGFADAWQPLIDRGATVFGLRDVRDAPSRVKSCMEAHTDDITFCDGTTEHLMRHADYLAEAAAQTPGAAEIDMTEFLCFDGTCPNVIGGVLVLRDSNHLSRTFARTLAPYILEKVEAQG